MDVKNFAKVFDAQSRQVLFYKDELTEDQISERRREELQRIQDAAEDGIEEEPEAVAPFLVRVRFYLLDGALSEMSIGFMEEKHRDEAFERVNLDSAEAAIEQVKWMEDILVGGGEDEDEED